MRQGWIAESSSPLGVGEHPPWISARIPTNSQAGNFRKNPLFLISVFAQKAEWREDDLPFQAPFRVKQPSPVVDLFVRRPLWRRDDAVDMCRSRKAPKFVLGMTH